MKINCRSKMFDEVSVKGARFVHEVGGNVNAQKGSVELGKITIEKNRFADLDSQRGPAALAQNAEDLALSLSGNVDKYNKLSQLADRNKNTIDKGGKSGLAREIANYEQRLLNVQSMYPDSENVVAMARLNGEAGRVERRLNALKGLDSFVQDKEIDNALALVIGLRPSQDPISFLSKMKEVAKEKYKIALRDGVPTRDVIIAMRGTISAVTETQSQNELNDAVGLLYKKFVKKEA